VRVTFKNALIANNVADSVVAVLPNSEVTVTGSTCRDNTVLFGVVYVNGHLMLNNTTLSGNFAHLAGAGVCGDNGIVDIHQSNFTHNTARGAGGAAAFFSTRAKLREVYFTLNTAAGGGAVVLQDGNMTSDKCWFLNNTAGGNFTVPALRVLPFRTVGMGGAMLARDSNITMRTCELLFNYADREGGEAGWVSGHPTNKYMHTGWLLCPYQPMHKWLPCYDPLASLGRTSSGTTNNWLAKLRHGQDTGTARCVCHTRCALRALSYLACASHLVGPSPNSSKPSAASLGRGFNWHAVCPCPWLHRCTGIVQ